MIARLLPQIALWLSAIAIAHGDAIPHGDATPHGSPVTQTESARVKYILAAIPKREKLARAGNAKAAFAIDATLIDRPSPPNLEFPRLLVGKWRSPRHDYLYSADGKWIMLPVEDETTAGRWKIKGHQYYSSYSADEPGPFPDIYTIILLDRMHFVYTDGKYVFYETRLK